jgi:nitrite reductase/ring-hydroxylating ferredoxin subunit
VAAIGHVFAPAGRTASTAPQLGGSTGGGGGTGSGGTGGGGTTTTTVPTAGGHPKGTKIGAADQVPVGGAASFDDPATGNPAYVVQPTAGRFLAFSAICTHAGCTVNFDRANETFDCPCHGSIYNATTGAVIQGPAPSPLPSIPIAESGGQLYADG